VPEARLQLFQGYYFAKPTIIAGKKLDHSQLSLMKLMGLLLGDADTAELEAALKPEPGLTINLLRMTNSVGAGCTEKSPRSAMPLPYSGAASCSAGCNCWFCLRQPGHRNPLLMMAATRGRLMELLAAEYGRATRFFRSGLHGRHHVPDAGIGWPADCRGHRATQPDRRCPRRPVRRQRPARRPAPHCRMQRKRRYRRAEQSPRRIAGLSPKAINRAQTQALQWANDIAREKQD
jgi:EAL and modified HD-GYP domain-containing signal transduction protein